MKGCVASDCTPYPPYQGLKSWGANIFASPFHYCNRQLLLVDCRISLTSYPSFWIVMRNHTWTLCSKLKLGLILRLERVGASKVTFRYLGRLSGSGVIEGCTEEMLRADC